MASLANAVTRPHPSGIPRGGPFGSFAGKVEAEPEVEEAVNDVFAPGAERLADVEREYAARERRYKREREEREELAQRLRQRYEKAREVVLAQPDAEGTDDVADEVSLFAGVKAEDTPPADEVDWRGIVDAGSAVIAEFERALARVEGEVRRRDDEEAAAVLLLMG